MKVCIGGTFNILHKGHRLLINKAFETAGKKGTVFIGITKGEMLKDKLVKKSFNERVESIKKYLLSKGYEKQAIIKAIHNKYGPTLEGDFDAIIVSPGTVETANEINTKREKKGLKPLNIVKIPYLMAEDNKPISSTRILNKEIDKEGKMI